MATFNERLASLKEEIAHIEYEMSDEVMAKKLELSNELYKLLDNNIYEKTLDISKEGVCVEGEYYDKYTDTYFCSCSHAVKKVYACENGDSYVESEEGDEFYFTENLTLKEVELIVDIVRYMLEEKEVELIINVAKDMLGKSSNIIKK